MPNQIEFEKADPKAEGRNWRQSRRQANPVIQMSVRMREDVYERFRDLCAQERRTNGDMLEQMMAAWLRENRK